jgi:membrane-bound serine protease (ClpP class)
MDNSSYLTLGAFLVGLGFLLLVADLFISSGVLLLAAVGCMLVGLGLLFKYDYEGKTSVGFYVLVGLLAGVPLTTWFLLRVGPLRRMVPGAPDPDDTMASAAFNQDLEALRGKYGKTLSALRPAGVVDFEGRRVDTLTEGMMVGPGVWVRCVDVQAGKVVVRPADRPRADNLETGIF